MCSGSPSLSPRGREPTGEAHSLDGCRPAVARCHLPDSHRSASLDSLFRRCARAARAPHAGCAMMDAPPRFSTTHLVVSGPSRFTSMAPAELYYFSDSVSRSVEWKRGGVTSPCVSLPPGLRYPADQEHLLGGRSRQGRDPEPFTPPALHPPGPPQPFTPPAHPTHHKPRAQRRPSPGQTRLPITMWYMSLVRRPGCGESCWVQLSLRRASTLELWSGLLAALASSPDAPTTAPLQGHSAGQLTNVM
ncbi:unnamed protein product [Gadus morhua 'NCC']